MTTMTGKITKKKVDNYAWGNKIAFIVNGQWISALVSKDAPENEVTQLLRELQEGDEAQFEITESKDKDKKGNPYLNIAGVVKVTRLGGDTGEKMDYSVGSPGEEKPKSNQTDGGFPFSMKVSYCKDLMIAFPAESDETLLLRVDLIKKMADRMGE